MTKSLNCNDAGEDMDLGLGQQQRNVSELHSLFQNVTNDVLCDWLGIYFSPRHN